MDINYIRLQAKRYNSGDCDQDRCLYEIAKQVSLFSTADFNQIQGGKLLAECAHWCCTGYDGTLIKSD